MGTLDLQETSSDYCTFTHRSLPLFGISAQPQTFTCLIKLACVSRKKEFKTSESANKNLQYKFELGFGALCSESTLNTELCKTMPPICLHLLKTIGTFLHSAGAFTDCCRVVLLSLSLSFSLATERRVAVLVVRSSWYHSILRTNRRKQT